MLPRMLTVDAFCEILVVRLSNEICPYGRLAAFLLSNRLLIMHKVCINLDKSIVLQDHRFAKVFHCTRKLDQDREP